MNVTEILSKARFFVQKGWTKGAFARDEHDVSVSPISDSACRWCLLGALRTVVGEGESNFKARLLLRGVTGYDDLGCFNDDCHSVDKVISALDRAICLSKSKHEKTD